MRTLAALAVMGSTACGNQVERVLIPIPDESEEATLVDFTGGDVTEPSAFDVILQAAVRTDQFPGWDFVLDFSRDGSATLWPRGGLIEEDSDAGLQQVARTFDELRSAPESGYEKRAPVPIEEGDVLAVQSRRDPSYGSVRCRRYAKVEVLAIDGAAGTMTFRYLANPNCEKHTLVPGAEE